MFWSLSPPEHFLDGFLLFLVFSAVPKDSIPVNFGFDGSIEAPAHFRVSFDDRCELEVVGNQQMALELLEKGKDHLVEINPALFGQVLVKKSLFVDAKGIRGCFEGNTVSFNGTMAEPIERNQSRKMSSG